MTHEDPAAVARSIVDANRFMALGTADARGTPWVSPVWFAPLSHHEYVWVSRPGTRHSRNLAERPQVAITIYDSHRPGGWSALYMAAVAEELEDVDEALECFQPRVRGSGAATLVARRSRSAGRVPALPRHRHRAVRPRRPRRAASRAAALARCRSFSVRHPVSVRRRAHCSRKETR